jgi:hypothetical protein
MLESCDFWTQRQTRKNECAFLYTIRRSMLPLLALSPSTSCAIALARELVFPHGAFSANVEGVACMDLQKNQTTALTVQLLRKNGSAAPRKSLATALKNDAKFDVHISQRLGNGAQI